MLDDLILGYVGFFDDICMRLVEYRTDISAAGFAGRGPLGRAGGCMAAEARSVGDGFTKIRRLDLT